MLRLLGICMMAAFLAWPGVPANADEALEWYQKGDRLSDEGRFEEAVEAYLHAIQANPEMIGPWFNLGLAHKSLQQYERAAAAFERALELDPDNLFIRLRLGNAYNLLEDWGRAIGHLNYVVHRLSDNAEAHGNLGWAYLNYDQGPRFKLLVILNLEKAAELFEQQGMKEAAEATRQTLEDARRRFSDPEP